MTLPLPSASVRRSQEILLPANIAGYRLSDLLGSGGQCVVYRGLRQYQDSVMPEEVALKCLCVGDVPEREVLERGFRRETELLSGLVHPNVVRAYGSGRVHNPHVEYLILELGECDAKSLAPGEGRRTQMAASITYDAASGLKYVHEQGVLHRDVKPQNFLVDRTGTVKLCDFGLSSSGGIEGVRGAGTPNYMAPEKLREHEDTRRSDVYSLGASLYHLLTGVAPFEGLPTGQMVREILDYGVPELDSDVAPAPLRQLVASMTHHDPKKRAGLDKVLEVCSAYRGDFKRNFRAA